jgi:hypothetical protein
MSWQASSFHSINRTVLEDHNRDTCLLLIVSHRTLVSAHISHFRHLVPRLLPLTEFVRLYTRVNFHKQTRATHVVLRDLVLSASGVLVCLRERPEADSLRCLFWRSTYPLPKDSQSLLFLGGAPLTKTVIIIEPSTMICLFSVHFQRRLQKEKSYTYKCGIRACFH